MTEPLTARAAQIRLAQYGERTKTWSTATYDSGTEKALHEIALALSTEVDRLRSELEKYVSHEPTVVEEMAYLSHCLSAVDDVCNAAGKQATRWENPLPTPEWVALVREAASGERPENGSDRRRRIYIDGTGNAWLSLASDGSGEYIGQLAGAFHGDETTETVRSRTGAIREIGRCW